MQINLYGHTFEIDVRHYTPAVPGSYRFDAASDVEYLGSPAELDFVVASAEYEDGSKVDDENLLVLIEELYNEICDAVECELQEETEGLFE